MLHLNKVTKTYHNTTNKGAQAPLFCDISLHVEPSEFVSIIGPSGCGKSTLLEICAGLKNFDQGKVIQDGKPVCKPGFSALMPQGDSLLPWLRLNENIALAMREFSPQEALKKANQLLEEFHMGIYAKRWPSRLSGGQKQRGALLRSLAYNKDLLLLDEPLGALDALTRKDIQIWLKNLIQHHQKAALMVTHDIDEAVFLSHRIYIMTPQRPLKEIIIDQNYQDRNHISFRRICSQIEKELRHV